MNLVEATYRSAIVRGLVPLLLFGSWPFVAFLANNQGRGFQHQDVFEAWVATLIAGCMISAGISGVFKRISFERAGFLVGFVLAVFFSFGIVSDLLLAGGIRLGTVRLLVWGCIFAGSGWLVWNVSLRPIARTVLLAAAATMTAVPAVDLGYGLLRARQVSIESTEPAQRPISGKLSSKHNVYWFMLDGYVRADSLAKYFGHDNTPFLSFLERRGFSVAQSALSNFDNTTNSLSSTLSMDYFHQPGQKRPEASSYTRILSGFNAVVRKFRGLGYKYIHAPYAGSSKTQCGGLEDTCIRARRTDKTPLSDVQVTLLKLTPLYRVMRKVFHGALTYDHLFVEDVAAGLENRSEDSIFVFAHILAPHAPPRYTLECKRFGDIAPMINVGESVYSPDQFWTDTWCLNKSIVKIVEKILLTDTSDPIIIINGDHGFKFRLPGEESATWDVASDRSLQVRRLAILNAVRMPERCRMNFYSSISPVNIFRLVFACLEDQEPEFIAERHFVRIKDGDGKRLFEVPGSK